jgi:S2P endopeptidase
MVDAGASFTVCMPIAFVTFSVASLKTLLPQARSRIVAAGPFHNLVLWIFLALVTRLGLFTLASFVSGYRHISDVGQVVIGVDAVSLFFMTAGSNFTYTIFIGLAKLVTKNAATDIWTKYLTGPTQNISTGWCLARNTLS